MKRMKLKEMKLCYVGGRICASFSTGGITGCGSKSCCVISKGVYEEGLTSNCRTVETILEGQGNSF